MRNMSLQDAGASMPTPPTAQSPSDADQPPQPPRLATGGGGYGNLKRGGYGGLGQSKATGEGPAAADKKKVFPKSANFARMPTGLEVEEDEKEAPQSARAAVRSWSASGGMREATFKKKHAPANKAVGFGIILQAAERPYSLSSLNDADDEDEGVVVAALMEELIIQVECEMSPTRLPNRAWSAQQDDDESDSADESRRLSMDLDAFSAAEGYAQRSELALAPPTQTVFGSVLGVSAEADQLARAVTASREGHTLMRELSEADKLVAPQPSDDEPGAKRGGYGKLGAQSNGASKHSRVASWSEDGGLREATFKKKASASSPEP